MNKIKYKITTGIILRASQRRFLLLNTANENCYEFDELAYKIAQLLTTCHSIEELISEAMEMTDQFENYQHTETAVLAITNFFESELLIQPC